MQGLEGDLTEANFGSDDDTMARLEDMGTSGADLVGNDMQRQSEVRALPTSLSLSSCGQFAPSCLQFVLHHLLHLPSSPSSCYMMVPWLNGGGHALKAQKGFRMLVWVFTGQTY